jgi:hypothetical protein
MERQTEVKRILIYECRCNEILKGKAEGSLRLAYTWLRGGLEHLKIETSLRGGRFGQSRPFWTISRLSKTRIKKKKCLRVEKRQKVEYEALRLAGGQP